MQAETESLSGDDYRVLAEIGAAHKAIRAELAKRIVGQEQVVEETLTAFENDQQVGAWTSSTRVPRNFA